MFKILSIFEILLGAVLTLFGSIIVFSIDSIIDARERNRKFEPHFFLLHSMNVEQKRMHFCFKTKENISSDLKKVEIGAYIQNSSESSFIFKKILINNKVYYPDNSFVDKNIFVDLDICSYEESDNSLDNLKEVILFIEDLLGQEHCYLLSVCKGTNLYISSIEKVD